MIKSKYTSAITDKPWWLAGGIPAQSCIIAYQAVGASSQAASYTNLANPGLYTAVPTSAPSWDNTAGFIFANKNLDTNYTLPQTLNMAFIVRISDYNEAASNHQWIIGGNNGSWGIRFRLNAATNVLFNGYQSDISATLGGVYAISRNMAFHNGRLLNTSTFAGGVGGQNLELGRLTDAGYNVYCNIQAVSVYAPGLTEQQVLAVSNAMNAL